MTPPGTALGDLRAVLAGPGFRRLLAVRVTSQGSDGLMQVALASLFFFSPERQATTAGVASAFAVLLLPFTLVGPWAGVLLDRWQRRQVLVWGNVVRAVTVTATGWALVELGTGPVLYGLVLLALSVNRFLLAALSAALPHVVAADRLVTANAVSPTIGSASAFVGATVGFAVRPAFPDGDTGDAQLLGVVVAVCLTAALLATRLGRRSLGPDDPERVSAAEALRRLVADLVAGVRHVRDRPVAGWSLLSVGAHRLAFAVTFIALILLSRNRLNPPGDPDAALATLGVVVAASGVGFVAAAVVTPVVVRRLGAPAWVSATLLLAAATQATLVVGVSTAWAVVVGLVLGLAAQGLKISVDTIVQHEVDDAFRGRVFVLYDAIYNAAFVGAAALSVLIVPDDGYARWLYAGIALWYAGAGLAYRHLLRPGR